MSPERSDMPTVITQSVAERSDQPALWALLFGNFVIALGVLAPAGIVNELTKAFSVDVPTVGTLIGYGAALLCVEAPLFAFLTNRIDRRLLLTGSVALYTVGHFASAFAPSFGFLLFTRLLMVGGAAIFTPQAASAVGLFVNEHKRSAAVTFIFMGWSLSAALGIPLATLLAAHFGFSATYLIIGGACLVATIGVAATMPHGLKAPPLSVHAWKHVFGSPKILSILAVTALSLTGQFVVYPFVAAHLKTSLSAGPELIAGLLALFGIAGIIGASITTATVDRIGPPKTVAACLCLVIGGLLLWFVSGSVVFAAVSIFVWGLGFVPANSSQQARLINAEPAVASASVALNTSSIYLGQAAGTFIGGQALSRGHEPAIGLIGAIVVTLALFMSSFAKMRFRA
jgi:DHA1 family inner membrane transport protein